MQISEASFCNSGSETLCSPRSLRLPRPFIHNRGKGGRGLTVPPPDYTMKAALPYADMTYESHYKCK